jgi:multidrug efflux system membrane fusion protein
VLALNNLIDTATGTIRIKATFENEDLSLFPNQFVNARLVIQILHDQNLVPTFAVQRNPEGAFVYVVTNGIPSTNNRPNFVSGSRLAAPPGTNTTIVTMRNITTGTADGNTTAVTKGLEPGDVIAVDNFNKLGEGVKVVPGKSEEAETPSGGDHKKGGGQHKYKPEGSKDSQ